MISLLLAGFARFIIVAVPALISVDVLDNFHLAEAHDILRDFILLVHQNYFCGLEEPLSYASLPTIIAALSTIDECAPNETAFRACPLTPQLQHPDERTFTDYAMTSPWTTSLRFALGALLDATGDKPRLLALRNTFSSTTRSLANQVSR